MIECATMPGVNGCLFSHALSPYSLRGTIPARAARAAAMFNVEDAGRQLKPTLDHIANAAGVPSAR
jgi:hypothetical protein